VGLSGGIPIPSDPHLRRWMLFVDGENLIFRFQNLAREHGIELREGPYYTRDVLIWIPDLLATTRFIVSQSGPEELQRLGVRAHYYTSTVGGEDLVGEARQKLWEMGFQPTVFKKPRNRTRTKGVDIALTTDLLSNAYRDNFDSAVLVAGDGDYVPLVEEVKRLGKVVHVAFFEGEGCGLSPELRLASDNFWHLNEFFLGSWRDHTAEDRTGP